MRLYHFSEHPAITRFQPHHAATALTDEALVWAIDEWHAPMYFFPRDCPRACFWSGEHTTIEDRDCWFHGVEARIVIAVEGAWLDRIRSATLYCYEMPPATFVLNDRNAGHYVSRQSVEPLRVEPLRDLLAALTDANVELRITPCLGPLWQAVVASSLEFSGTRLRNAADWPDGFGPLAHP
ncbi:MAG TPA: hypothetical protein VFY79_11405 [Dehalococcoidia bacterium]|nr:hypothetical protein [Dehalococcoidia bacterium]